MRLMSKYPEEFTNNRQTTEGSFIFCLWKSPELYGDYINIIDSNRDLLLPESRFYYTIGKEMDALGYINFDNNSILTYLDGKTELLSIFNGYGGYKTVEEMKSILDIENIDAYYDELAKGNMLLELYDNGFDLTGIADKFDGMTSQQAYDYCDYIISDSTLKTVNTGLEMVDLASGYEDWVDKWDSGTGVGYKVGFPMLNYHLAGIHKNNLILHLAGIGEGKAMVLDAKIMTPSGYMEMGDMTVGQEIFGDDGEVYHVTGVYPQGKKDIYRVTFDDGSSTETCDEHLWNVRTSKDKHRGKGFKTKTLREIMDEPLYNTNNQGHKQWLNFIPMTSPLKFSKDIAHKINPYVLGIIIGDGNISDVNSSVRISMTEADIIDYIRDYCHSNQFDLSNSSDEYRIIEKVGHGRGHNRIKAELNRLGLMGCYSYDKFIPEEYLYSSVENRIELLSGLIDSDGEVNNSLYVYSTVSTQLKDDVVFLVHSLGGTANVEDRQTYYTHNGEKKAGRPSYRIRIKMPVSIRPIKSKKHLAKFKVGQTEARRVIKSIEYIGKEEAQCISTSNPSQLYLTDDMIVTHNTTSSISTYVLPVLESGESICILANEQDEEEFRQMLLATVIFNKIGYFKMNRQKLLFGNFTKEDRVAIDKAIEWLKQYEGQLHYGHLTDYRTESISRVIKKYSKIGVGIFLIDTLKPEDETSDRAWAEFSETSKELFMLSQKEDVAIVATAQLSGASSSRRFLDLSCIGKSKAIAETAGQVIMFRPLTQKEKEEMEVYTYMKDGNGKYMSIKNIITLHPEKDYIVLFIAKNRYGRSNVQLVYERNMDFNTMKELGYTDVEYDGFGR